MKRRSQVAAGVIVGASIVLGGISGVAGAAESGSSRPGSSIMEAMCKASHGAYYEGKIVAYCWLPDGSTIACYSDGYCTKYPPLPKKQTLSPSSGVSQVAAR